MSLVVENLTVGYYNKVVLEAINMEFKPGQITALIGKNGCGKSTLLKTIVGLVKKQSGNILLDGNLIENFKGKALAQKLSYLPQIHTTSLDLDVKTIVSLGQYPYQGFWPKSKLKDELLQEALNKFNLSSLANKPYNKLSGGEAQRVWLAMLYIGEPNYILLDEPTTFLDIGYQIELLEYLKDLAKNKNMGIVLVIHDLNLASRYADYIYLLDNKRLKCAGPSNQVITKEILAEVFGFKGEVIKKDNKSYLLP